VKRDRFRAEIGKAIPEILAKRRGVDRLDRNREQ
jgi:hypothetical protein